MGNHPVDILGELSIRSEAKDLCRFSRSEELRGCTTPFGQEKLANQLSKQRTLPPIRSDPEMLISQLRSHPSPWCAVQETNLNQERLVNLLNCIRLLRQHRCQSIHAHRAALILLNNREQQLAVNFVEPMAIHFQHL